MPVVKLTPAFVRTVQCPAERRKIDYFDSEQRGLMLEVRPSGGMTWFQRYTDERGRTRTFKIGPAKIIGLSQARLQGRKLVAAAALGSSPQDQREDRRRAPALAEFVELNYLPHVREHRQSWRDVEVICLRHILPPLGKLKVDELTSGDVIKVIANMRVRGYADGTTNKVRSALYSMYTLGRKWKVPGFKGENPIADVAPRPQVFRERYLTEEETVRLIRAIHDDRKKPGARAIMLLLLTGARKREVSHAKWESVDLERGLLRVPRSKNGRPRHIVLSQFAINLLKTTPHVEGNPWIFPSQLTGRPCPTLYPQWKRIRKRAGMPTLRIHDLRHSFASFLVNRGVSLYVVQDLLGHSTPKTTQRYSHLAPKTLQDAAAVVAGVVEDATKQALAIPPAAAQQEYFAPSSVGAADDAITDASKGALIEGHSGPEGAR